MIFYLIPLLFIDIFLIFTAFKGFIMSSLENNKFYSFIGMLSIGLFAFISCEVILDILEFYFPIAVFQKLSVNPLYATIVSLLIMSLVYKSGTKWVEGYLVNLKKSE